MFTPSIARALPEVSIVFSGRAPINVQVAVPVSLTRVAMLSCSIPMPSPAMANAP